MKKNQFIFMKNKNFRLFICLISALAVLALAWFFYFRFFLVRNELNIPEKSFLTEDSNPESVNAAITPESEMPVNSYAGDVSADAADEVGSAAIANPASAFCAEKGGSLRIETRGDGGQFGLCYFEDNRACEEWSLMRGECPVGGRRTTGYDTEAQKYCAWLGGEVLAETDAMCSLPDGRRCLAADLYQGYDCPVAASRE